jgi:hypothetical protein
MTKISLERPDLELVVLHICPTRATSRGGGPIRPLPSADQSPGPSALYMTCGKELSLEIQRGTKHDAKKTTRKEDFLSPPSPPFLLDRPLEVNDFNHVNVWSFSNNRSATCAYLALAVTGRAG